MFNSLWPHGLQHARLPCPSLSPRVCSNPYPLIRWCHPTISSCRPFLLLPLIFPCIRVFSNELALSIRWAKYWSFSISPSSEYSGLISFRVDRFDLFAVQGTLKSPPAPQFKNINSSLWSNSQIYTWLLEKTIALTIWIFVGKVMSLLFNTVSRFAIAFLPRTQCLLISWLQSPSAVILEPKKIKSVIVSTFSPSVCHEVWDQMPWS